MPSSFPTPHIASTNKGCASKFSQTHSQLLAIGFSSWDQPKRGRDARCWSISSAPLLTRMFCALFSSPVLNQEHCKAGSGSSSLNCAGMHNSKLWLIRGIGMRWGSYAKSPIRLCMQGERTCCHCPAQMGYFDICVMHVSLFGSLCCAWVLDEKDQSPGIAVFVLKLSWLVIMVPVYSAY